jgi:hypothetical protein
MKPSQKIATIAMASGLAAGLASAFWLLEGADWWVHIAIGAGVAVGGNTTLLKIEADKKIVDGD